MLSSILGKAVGKAVGWTVYSIVFLSFACGNSASTPPKVLDHSAEITSGNALIAQVTATLDSEGLAYVEYQSQDSGKFRTPTTPELAAEHVIPIVRLTPSTTYAYIVVSIDDKGNEFRSKEGSFTTGVLPEALSTLQFEHHGRPTSELLLLDHREVEGSVLFMLNQDSKIVWYYISPNPVEGTPHPTTGLVQKANGNILYHLSNPFEMCCIREITPLGELVDNLDAGAFSGVPHRDLTLLPDGRVLYPAWNYQLIDDSPNGGDAKTLVEGLTLRVWNQQSGLTQEVWNAFDSIGTDVRVDWDTGRVERYPGQITLQETLKPIRWTGANSVQIGPRGNIIVSIVNLSKIISISPDFERVEWTLGGPESTYIFEDPSNKFYRQHSAQQLPNGNILLFDNGRGRPEEEGGEYSRALELVLGDYDLVATKVWEYRHSPDLYAKNRSSAFRLENGNTLLNFVTDPRVVVEVDPEANEVYKVQISGPRMQGSFRAYTVPSVMGETSID